MSQDTGIFSSVTSKATAPVAKAPTDWTASKTVADVVARCAPEAQRVVVRAPGRLDVMGGIAEYTGSLVLQMPTAEHVIIAVQPRTDGLLRIESSGPQADGAEPREAFRIATADVFGVDGRVIAPSDGAERVTGDSTAAEATRCLLGTVAELQRTIPMAKLKNGLTIIWGSTMARPASTGQSSALSAAALVALSKQLPFEMEPAQAAALCQRVANHWLHLPVGPASSMCALVSEPHALLQIQCKPLAHGASIPLPDDVILLGIDCGKVQADAHLRYERVRAAAMMGAMIIDRIVRFEKMTDIPWNGHLSSVAVTDFVNRFRDRLPTKIRGADYLRLFGETGDPLTRIEPDLMYKIRSRVEHHIYENSRAHQFVEGLSRAIRVRKPEAFQAAGELMYASHWSYGQRCGLGSIETDTLVNLLRRHGAAFDIHGAKVSGPGCGGMVIALMLASDNASAALRQGLQAYVESTDLEAHLVQGSSAGAMVAGEHRG